jgi:hypothetical protein
MSETKSQKREIDISKQSIADKVDISILSDQISNERIKNIIIETVYKISKIDAASGTVSFPQIEQMMKVSLNEIYQIITLHIADKLQGKTSFE